MPKARRAMTKARRAGDSSLISSAGPVGFPEDAVFQTQARKFSGPVHHVSFPHFHARDQQRRQLLLFQPPLAHRALHPSVLLQSPLVLQFHFFPFAGSRAGLLEGDPLPAERDVIRSSSQKEISDPNTIRVRAESRYSSFSDFN
jgi:hypothetical protein